VASRLSEVEVVSAFARLAREHAITVTQRNRLAKAFAHDFSTWYTVELTPQVTAIATALLSRHELRAGDAIQLAAALAVQVGLDEPIEMFVAADDQLIEAAAAEGLPPVEPELPLFPYSRRHLPTRTLPRRKSSVADNTDYVIDIAFHPPCNVLLDGKNPGR
jgi:hypothetical protein